MKFHTNSQSKFKSSLRNSSAVSIRTSSHAIHLKKGKILPIMCLCSFLVSCENMTQADITANPAIYLESVPSTNYENNSLIETASKVSSPTVLLTESDYKSAYKVFLHRTDIDSEHDFPIWGYYLFDLNFDGIPELGVLHDSGGSMGGYFTFYRFDGKEIVPAVLNDENQPAQISNYTQILANYEKKETYFLKEMYLLRGNNNGTYGYVQQVTDQNGILYVSNILRLTVDQEQDLENYNVHDFEDDYLSDETLASCLITEYYSDGKWEAIPPETYLSKKRALIPDQSSFIDIRDTNAYILLCESVYEFHNKPITDEEIDTLFANWAIKQYSVN